MEIGEYLSLLSVFERLKNTLRHCYMASGRQESVAEHSHRLAVMAYFVKDEYPNADISKVILMCLIHDLGEAFTGDIPTFRKTETDEDREEDKIDLFLKTLPEPYRGELTALFKEMQALETQEAKLCKALDQMEAVIQHNESDIETWLPLEYELQLTHGEKYVAFSDFTLRLKEACNRITREKIDAKQNSSK